MESSYWAYKLCQSYNIFNFGLIYYVNSHIVVVNLVYGLVLTYQAWYDVWIKSLSLKSLHLIKNSETQQRFIRINLPCDSVHSALGLIFTGHRAKQDQATFQVL